MARKGGGSTKKGHAWAGRQSPKLQDIKFPKYFKTDAVKRYANHSPNDLLIEFDEIEPDMPEKRLMFAMLKSAIKEYLAVPKCRWRDHLTMIYELPRKNNKRTRLMGELLNSRRAYRWLHSISNEPFSYRWIASELSLPWSLPALVDSLVIDAE